MTTHLGPPIHGHRELHPAKRKGGPKDVLHEVESVQIPLGSARLVDWPCANVGAELVELVGGLSLPEALVQNMGSRDQRSALGAEIARLDHTSDFVRSRTGG